MANADKRPGMLTGLFHDRESAERAWQGLSDRGYTRDDVSVVMSDETRRRHFGQDSGVTTELGTKAAEGAGIGGGIGGAVGAALAAVAATGTSIALPGLGLATVFGAQGLWAGIHIPEGGRGRTFALKQLRSLAERGGYPVVR